MKRNWIIATGAALVLTLASLAQSYAVDVEVNGNAVHTAHSKANYTVRASEMIGKNIYNGKGESIAEINDIVLDPNTGRVRYAAVTYGGFLGIGDKMFAVPWEAFSCTQDPDDADEHRLTLNVTKEQLNGAKGFDKDHWPNFAEPNFINELDTRYRVKRNRVDGVNVDVGRGGVDVDINKRPRRDN